MAPIREAVPPLFELVTPMPFVALQQMFNESAAWGTLGYEKALYLDELSDGAIEVIGEHVPKKTSPLSFCPTFTPRRRVSERARRPTRPSAAAGRPGLRVQHRRPHAPARELYAGRPRVGAELLGAHAAARRGSGSYVNFMVESDDDRVKARVRRGEVRAAGAHQGRHGTRRTSST